MPVAITQDCVILFHIALSVKHFSQILNCHADAKKIRENLAALRLCVSYLWSNQNRYNCSDVVLRNHQNGLQLL